MALFTLISNKMVGVFFFVCFLCNEIQNEKTHQRHTLHKKKHYIKIPYFVCEQSGWRKRFTCYMKMICGALWETALIFTKCDDFIHLFFALSARSFDMWSNLFWITFMTSVKTEFSVFDFSFFNFSLFNFTVSTLCSVSLVFA